VIKNDGVKDEIARRFPRKMLIQCT